VSVARRVRYIIAGLSGFLALGQSSAQLTDSARPETQLSGADLHQDFLVLERIYKELHPGLYRYNTPPQMAAHFAELDRRLSRDQTLESAYLAVSQFLALIKCGHTHANFFNQSEFPTSSQPDAGLVPDILVRYTATDIAKGVDRTLQAALNVATKRPAN
jgi:hypothetical protein